MNRLPWRTAAVIALGLPLAGCNEFSVNCATPKGSYLLMVKQGIPWGPVFGPEVRWVTPTDVHDLKVLRSDGYQVRAELGTRVTGWPEEAERQLFVVNRITSEFHTSFQRAPKPSGDEARKPDDAIIEAVNGSCSRVFPQRL